MTSCRLHSWLLALILLAGLDTRLPGQESASAIPPASQTQKPAKAQFFAGLVVEADAEHVKVSRSSVGRPPETHVFAINAQTKTPKGGLKAKTRVTVRYQHMPEQDLALEIQVRTQSHTQKPS